MDPNQAWADLANAYEAEDQELVQEIATALQTWLNHGGFAPTITGRPNFDALVISQVLQRFI